MTEQRPVRERLRELAAKERGYLAGLPPPLAWSDRAPWEAGIRQAIRTLDKIEAAAITELDTLERRADAERARTAVLETALRTLVDSVERPAAPDSEWLEQAVIEARAALATPAEGAGGVSRVLVACEFSGIVRDAFIEAGHDAVSCDLLPSERPGPHIVGDAIVEAYRGGWDLMVAHPPCTYLAVSGARWFAGRRAEQAAALAFVQVLLDAPIPRIALENPVSVISSRIRKPDQIVQPWWFGHGETKATCLWLKGLPKLEPTNIVPEREPRVHHASPGPDRWKERSRTLPGIAKAMAQQWGAVLENRAAA